MQNIENKTASSSRRRLSWIGLGLVVVLAVGAGIRFSTQRAPKPAKRQHAPMASMADMKDMPSMSDDWSDSSASSSGIQVDLGPDDLQKAQVQTVHLGMRETANTLRVPGNINPDEYKEVHVTPLVGGVIRQVPVVLGDHVKRGQTLAVVFSSELATAESEYLAMLAELEADHKKLERTQNLVKLGAASQQEEDDVTADHASHEAHVRSALERLKLLGASDRQI